MNKLSWQRNLKNGDEVTWNDPDNGLCSKTGVIQEIKFSTDIVSITWQDGSVTECFLHELS